ncbi:MAG: VOC family protein [Caldilineaceae bacterium]|nr:VOC family protein [Caldilineaceae bacterium]
MIGKPSRPGFRTITPYLIVRDLAAYLVFLHQAFGATEHLRATGAAGGNHVELRIGDSMLMLGEAKTGIAEPTQSMLFLYFEAVDAVYTAALAAGATTLMPPTDGAFGEPRGAGVKDMAGNEWYFANWIDRPDAPPTYVEEPEADVIPMLTYEDGPAALDWLAAAFGFQEVTRWLDAEGRLSHGEMITGSGQLMLATPTPAYQNPKHHRAACEAARAWSQVPWVINGVLVYVADVDAHFARAQQMGATILSAIEEGFPGRRYRVEDLEGHRWMFMERP